MNITANTFKASFPSGTVFDLVIANAQPFTDKSTGKLYIPGELVRQTITADSSGDLPVQEIVDIPATNETDVGDLFYQVRLVQKKGRNETLIKFYFGGGETVSDIRIPATTSGSITWEEIRAAYQARYPVSRFTPSYLDVDQQFNTFLQKSQFDSYLQQITDLLTTTISSGGTAGDGTISVSTGGTP